MGEECPGREAGSLIMHLNMIVEGVTEETFVREVLAPYFGNKGIYVVARSVETSRRKSIIYRGGCTTYDKMRRDIKNWIRQHRDAYCTTMFDLYGLPRNFPGKDSMDPNVRDYQRVRCLEKAFADDIGSHRFIPYIQLHEFEALLFADIDKMRAYFFDDRAIERLKNVASCFDSPELINEGTETAPSKRIIREIPEYKDNKIPVGPGVAKEIGLPTLRARCAHFCEWISRIENLVQK